MKTILLIILATTLAGCGSISKMVEQADGTYKKVMVATVTSFGRDIVSKKDADIDFDEPLTQESIDNYKGWMKDYLIAGMIRLDAKEELSSKSNVKGTIGAATDFIKTGIDTGSKLVP